MRIVTLTSQDSTPDGVFSDWVSDSGFKCKTLELPWDNNIPDKSCIPSGWYDVTWAWSAKHNCNLYHVQGVPNRSNVEIHSANVIQQLLGCLAPGSSVVTFGIGNDMGNGLILPRDQQGVAQSKFTLSALEADLRDDNGNQVPFRLNVIRPWG